jgi:hypothetical protein
MDNESNCDAHRSLLRFLTESKKTAQMGQVDFAKNKKGCFHERSTLIFSTMRAMTAQQ